MNITLREFLSKLLRCDPMRITKKFEGDNSLRKVVYKRVIHHPQESLTNDDAVREEIRVLETAFLDRLEKTKSSSSQALADRALLDTFQESGVRDLIELFCLGMVQEAESARMLFDQEGRVMDHHHHRERKRHLQAWYGLTRGSGHHYNYGAANNEGDRGHWMAFQRDLLIHLLIHLLRMQQLIQQQQQFGPADTPAAKRFKTDPDVSQEEQPQEQQQQHSESTTQESTETTNQQTIESNYNAATSNLLSIQRMILENQHKLYDLEFNLAEVQVQQQHVAENECNLDTNNVAVGDEERKKEVMACIQREIENLERQKSEIEQEIETKYKSASLQIERLMTMNNVWIDMNFKLRSC
jgi:hypothetical protein